MHIHIPYRFLRTKFLVVTLLALLLTSCINGPASEFCSSNGYAPDTIDYKQCVAYYNANRELYEYCKTRVGIVQIGEPLNQCLANARQLRTTRDQDNNACRERASRKFAPLFNQPKQETQATLQNNGDIIIGAVSLGSGYNGQEQENYTGPYMQQCMQATGWSNPGNWQDGKYTVDARALSSLLASLDNAPIIVTLPEHPTVKLFEAVAQGNVYGARDIARGIGVNSQNYQGYTALHVAVSNGNFQIVQMLMQELNADPYINSANGENAIVLAARGRNPEIASYITVIMHDREVAHIRAEEHRRFEEEKHRRQQEHEQQRQKAEKQALKEKCAVLDAVLTDRAKRGDATLSNEEKKQKEECKAPAPSSEPPRKKKKKWYAR
jgi:hypothetical protein